MAGDHNNNAISAFLPSLLAFITATGSSLQLVMPNEIVGHLP